MSLLSLLGDECSDIHYNICNDYYYTNIVDIGSDVHHFFRTRLKANQLDGIHKLTAACVKVSL